ncbi:sugar phosphate isomerase/epimerase family protein [Enterococcus columbae]|uniref:Xylose isomerase-like TIM barrel domain-containing protein n=1 Tax=Enterococcus columbae DSM 7374 = ATCC 51263 TaxID=1121865 RepID=S1NWF4_9ENTE|nr:sugar phosphate isomerase/epimerase family protein [Enterococcus columbae]EOT44333.1 hypothetical protein OMW_00389 [Enterococcus columbae DSM 7374 = ATCC 51263]EOW84491.1 hypothetical protein I568_00987 [Enterococcus columbae DSM 7374 = ATCC 51263]
MRKLMYAMRGHDFQDYTTPESLAQKMAMKKINAVQLALAYSFSDIATDDKKLSPGLGYTFQQAFQKEHVLISILSCYINMIHPDKQIREQLLQRFESYIRYASFFGAKIVATETGNVLPVIQYTEKNFTDEAFETMISSVLRLVQYAEKQNICVGIEPGINHPLHSIEKIVRLLDKIHSPSLGIILDPTNLITSDNYNQQYEMVKQCLELFSERIVAFHIKDFIIKGDKIVPVNLGQGLMDYKALLDLIEAYKPYCLTVLEETKEAHISSIYSDL